jgi:hypothetical protein
VSKGEFGSYITSRYLEGQPDQQDNKLDTPALSSENARGLARYHRTWWQRADSRQEMVPARTEKPRLQELCSTGDVRRTYFHPAVSWRIENLYRHVNGKFLLVTLVCKELQKTLVSYTHIVWLQFSCELHGL